MNACTYAYWMYKHNNNAGPRRRTTTLRSVSHDRFTPLQEFASAACLLKGSPDEDKLARE